MSRNENRRRKKLQRAHDRAKRELSTREREIGRLEGELREHLIVSARERADIFLRLLYSPEGEETRLLFVQAALEKNVIDEAGYILDEGGAHDLAMSLADKLGMTADELFGEDSRVPEERRAQYKLIYYQEVAKVMVDTLLTPSPRMLSKTDLWSDRELTTTGMALWKRTYRLGRGDRDVIRESRSVAHAWSRAAAERGIETSPAREAVVQTIVGWSAKWAVHAFQRITTSHTFASALMCSDASRDALEDIEMQWHAFMVMLPNGVLAYEDDRGVMQEYNRLLVGSFEGQACLILVNQTGGSEAKHRIVIQVSESIAALLDVGDVDLAHTLGDDAMTDDGRAKVQRVVVLAKRLVAGLLFSMQHQNNFRMREVPARAARSARDTEEPAHRVVFVGRPLKVDCRPQVRAYIAHGSKKKGNAPPTVQTLVRGHFKRQVMGIARSGRKVIWIEPYWRGPDDAPILVHPFNVGS